jgi:hypothetical protein
MPCAVRPHYSWRLVPLTDGIHSGWYRIRWSRSPDPGPTHLFAVSPRRMAHSVAQTKWPCQSSADTSSGSLASAKCSALAAIQWSDSLAVQPVASGPAAAAGPLQGGASASHGTTVQTAIDMRSRHIVRNLLPAAHPTRLAPRAFRRNPHSSLAGAIFSARPFLKRDNATGTHTVTARGCATFRHGPPLPRL